MPNYSPTSVQVFGKPNAPIQWRDSGNFWESIFTRREDETSIEISASDEKTESILSDPKGGEKVLGIGEEGREEIALGVIESLQDWYIKKLTQL